MDKFIFVLGSNWQLSLAELDTVLKNSEFKGRITDYSANIAIVEFDDLLDEKYYIDKLMELQFILGGTQKICRIFDFIHIQIIQSAFPKHVEKFKLVEKQRNKITSVLESVLSKTFGNIKKQSIFFAVSIYPDLFDDEYYSQVLAKHFLPFLNKTIMAILKQKGAKKSLYYKYPEKNIKSGHLNPIFPHHLTKYGLFNEDRAEIIFGFTEEGVYIGRTFTADDPNFKKKIDEERPHREFKSTISPKLALIMLNFLNLFEDREHKKILDPFVGNGTIPMLASVQGFQVYGSDIDDVKVNNTIRNLNWLLKLLEEEIPYMLNKRFVARDVSNISDIFSEFLLDGICTEPSLGPFFKEKPYYTEIKELIKGKLEPLYKSLFLNARQMLKSRGRIVLVAPVFTTVDGGDIQIHIEKIGNLHGFKLVPMIEMERIVNKSNKKLQLQEKHIKSLLDAKKGQVVKRKLYVFEKNK
ncbi:MAG: TRM11 family SAM-dependent methyltransferase [Promethearchaeota archaeon]